jgi:hypothetical protein
MEKEREVNVLQRKLNEYLEERWRYYAARKEARERERQALRESFRQWEEQFERERAASKARMASESAERLARLKSLYDKRAGDTAGISPADHTEVGFCRDE